MDVVVGDGECLRFVWGGEVGPWPQYGPPITGRCALPTDLKFVSAPILHPHTRKVLGCPSAADPRVGNKGKNSITSQAPRLYRFTRMVPRQKTKAVEATSVNFRLVPAKYTYDTAHRSSILSRERRFELRDPTCKCFKLFPP